MYKNDKAFMCKVHKITAKNFMAKKQVVMKCTQNVVNVFTFY